MAHVPMAVWPSKNRATAGVATAAAAWPMDFLAHVGALVPNRSTGGPGKDRRTCQWKVRAGNGARERQMTMGTFILLPATPHHITLSPLLIRK